ncbi:MAG: signal recognition particle protein [Saprospiraceae bacterium]|jgi:signal recognition particle subunit SRP54|uniref:Signal recognition particle protein n=1 Tax=Candidatus Defluviibacterium haderslevense TaxID=2981993 RepID=A0A9D7SC60_9BACT|nr:signal recognition particle protein [Candidatus Defluviibacterium haderslevense]MCC7025610.1 signal recognition particle protein [Saprospiraceae bacterium]MBK8244100.1 signal recognition particle protein [Candidatus Defluviibacterium haderslevense]MBK9718716.1 signal recognition particle protein [Candidatus Defluviibacterium haderslevense]MBL0235212.1 signal recognition particle protein [Candidatus Defluviibacterium haderslevense]
MFENLSEKLELAFKGLKGEGTLTELNVAESIKEIRRALVGADVNYKIAKEFTDKIKEKALGSKNVLKSVKPGELMVKIVLDELVDLMGGQAEGLNLNANPAVILVSGLQGSGKTTFSGKLALFLKTKKNKKVLLTACDVYRPAAIDQLTVIAEQVGVEIFKDIESKDPVDISLRAIAYAKEHKLDLVIIDTAGRTAVDEEMMSEIERIKNTIKPTETLFVVDSMTGQDAVNTALAFNERINYDGVVLTKMDGDSRGGAALSIKYTIGKPIKFVSEGEKMETLDIFYPDRMAQRILGMGDIVSLVEKAQEQFDEKEAKKIESKIRQNKFDFNDFLVQLNQIKKMGDIKSILGMMPGVGKMVKDIDIDDKAFKKVEAIIQSMTPKERGNPELLNMARKTRIANGCGRTIHEVNAFIKQFDEMRKMMLMMSKGQNMGNMMKQMQNMRK